MKQIPKDKFVKLTSITKNNPVDVYDLEVEQDHEFYANGFLVHNCLGNYHPHGDKACLRGDTIVPILCGAPTTIKNLVDSGAGPKNVLAYNPVDKKFVVTTAHSWRATKLVLELVKVHLSSGEHITCTADHEILTNFGWCEAANLNVGDSCVGGTIRYQDIKMNDGKSFHIENFPKSFDTGISYKNSVINKGTAWYENNVVFVEQIFLDEPEYVYDFTSSSQENMIVFTSDGLKTKNFCVVHNCYDAIVNAAVNQNIAMVHGEGNFGTMTEGPAAMRYCFTEDAKVMVMAGEKMLMLTFKELASTHDIYKKVGEVNAKPMIVVTKDGVAAPSHVVCSGIQETVEVFDTTGNSVRCTPNEPFSVYCTATNSYSWIDAERLLPGNLLVRANYDTENKHITYSVVPVLKVEARGPDFVYDLCVPEGHSFTANGFVVHNTNLKLSKYSDLVFFDKFYMPTVEYVPNYDGSRKEPLVLPALLPNAVLNGNFGIAPGVNTRSPMFSLKSVAKVLQKMLESDGKCSTKMCMGLEFTTASGGSAYRTKTNKQDFENFFQTGKGRVTFLSTSTDVDKTNSIRFDRFAPISDIEKVMTKIESIKGVQSTRDDSDENDPFKTAFVITFAKNQKGESLAALVKQVHAVLTSNYTFDIKVTDRFIQENGQAGAKLRATSIPEMLEEWLEYRIKIEIVACKYWVQEAENKIAYLDLLRVAIANIDTIIKHIKNKKLDDFHLTKAIGKDLKISDAQVNLILARNLRQLRHLEDQKLLTNIKELRQEIKGYNLRIKKPTEYISSNIREIVAKIEKKK